MNINAIFILIVYVMMIELLILNYDIIDICHVFDIISFMFYIFLLGIYVIGI